MTLLDLQRWSAAARDVSRFRASYEPYVKSDVIDDELKEAAAKEFADDGELARFDH